MVELLEVRTDGPVRDTELSGDLFVGEAGRGQVKNLRLAGGYLREPFGAGTAVRA